MKKIIQLISIILLLSLCTTQSNAQTSTLTKGTADRFSGEVWVQYFVTDTANDFLASKVIFEPNARSNWHFHLGKQIIFCVDGEGYYKEKGKPTTILKKGDVVIIEPQTIHSHGASRTKKFIQTVVMNGVNLKNGTIWLNRVTDEELEMVGIKN